MLESLLRLLRVEDPTQTLAVVGLVGARIAPLTVFAPWLTLRRTPPLVRASIIVALTVGLAPMALGSAELSAANGVEYAGWVLREVMIGTLFAIITALPFYALDWAGRLVDTWRGAALAEVIAPPTGERTSPLGDFYLLFGIALFLALGGHRLALEVFAESLVQTPIGGALPSEHMAAITFGAARLTGDAMAFAVAVAAPAAAAIVLVEVSLGLLARTVPQVPVFFAGMPLRAATGLAASLLGLSLVVGQLGPAFTSSIDAAARWVEMLDP